jgi:hypothetical protein
MSSKKDCHINPLTGRAIKTSGVTYKKLMEKEKKVTTIQASIQSKKAQSNLNQKKDAVNKLKAVVKRTTTKKPDPPKKFGYEDLPGDVKGMITDKVYDNMSDKELLKYLKERMKKLNMTYPGYTKYNKIQLIKVIKDSFDFEKKNNIKPKTDDDFKNEYKNKKRNEMIKEINEKVDDLTDGGKIPALNKLTNKDLYYLLYEGGIEEKFEKYINKKKSKKKKKMTIADVIQIPPSSP